MLGMFGRLWMLRLRFGRSVNDQHRAPSRIESYLLSLRQRYPLADPASLVASFIILHELTAIVPLFGGFYALKQLGVGESVVNWTIEGTRQADAAEASWPSKTVAKWVKEGDEQAGRIGRRYGVFGFEKESKEATDDRKRSMEQDASVALGIDRSLTTTKVGGDVANLVAAYLLVKALIPLRLILSARLAPPLATILVSRLRGLRAIGSKWMKRKG